jgi:uncharacterized protein with HEPN domain
MRRDPRALLWDVREAADDIAAFTAGMDVDAYVGDPLVRAAVERKFEIIGEALNRLSKEDPGLAGRVPDLAAVVGFRNMLSHGYAVIDDRRVWRIVETSLPPLRRTVAALLDELG